MDKIKKIINSLSIFAAVILLFTLVRFVLSGDFVGEENVPAIKEVLQSNY